jgi:hypothetical protein
LALVRLGKAVNLGANASGGRARLGKVSADSRGQERAEDDLSAAEDGQREPQKEHKLEDEVEGKPVDDVDEALQDGEQGEDNPVLYAARQHVGSWRHSDEKNLVTYGQPLRVILGARSEESCQRVVSGDDESSKVGEKLAAEVEDDQEKVQGTEADGSVGFGNAGRLLEVVEGGVLGELSRRFVRCCGGQGSQRCSCECQKATLGASLEGHSRGDWAYLAVDWRQDVLGFFLRGSHFENVWEFQGVDEAAAIRATSKSKGLGELNW